MRLGYAFDGATVTKRYPTAFGPPPASTQMVTCGIGYRRGPVQLNAAYSFRFGRATVTPQDVESTEVCAFCGHPGEYALTLHGLYFDLSYSFEDR